MTGWKPHRLDQLGSVARGRSRHRPRNDPALYGGPWPFFQTGDVKAAELYLRNFTQTYSEAGLAQSKLWPTGTLCITIAANIADTAILAIPGCFPDSVVGFIANPAKSDARFVKYCIDTLKQGMQNASHGTTQDNLSVDKLLTFDFVVPPVAEQRRIALILSAYDDLIENNSRRIAILEEMARRIYEEWFVRFRFPGHEGVRMVESKLGLVPEGWRCVPVTDVAAFKYGNGLPTKHLADDAPFPVYGASKIIGRYTEYTREDRTLIVGCRGSVGVPQITLARCFVTNNSFTADPVHPAGQLWLYLLLQSRGLQDVIGGAAQPQITLEGLSGAAVLNPPPPLIDRFDALVRPMFQLQWSLIGVNENLRTTRDLLLPKLISGELDVSAAPKPEAVAA